MAKLANNDEYGTGYKMVKNYRKQKAANGGLHISFLHIFRDFQMKRLALLIVALFYVSAFAQDPPKIAVYVTGDKQYISDNNKKALQTSILSKLVNSGRYIAVERSEEFLSQVDAEHIKQRSGAIDETQISQLGRQFGLKFICVADINPAFNTYHVSARIIDVETAALVFIRDATSNLQTMADLKQTVDEIIGNMLDSKIATPQTQEIVNSQGQMLMKAKYDDTEIYATEHFAALGSPVAIVGPKDVLAVLEEGKNYYKVRTASGKEGFAVKRDLVSSVAEFVDMRPEAPPVTRREAAERKQKEAEKRTRLTTSAMPQIPPPSTSSYNQLNGTGASIFIATLPSHADVYIGGRHIGRSNDGELQVPVGTHQVRFVKGNVEKTESMTFSPGKNPTLFVPLAGSTSTVNTNDRPRVLGNRIGIEFGLGLGRLGGSGSASVPSLESYSKYPDTNTVDGTVEIHVDLIYVDIYGYGFGGYGIQTNSHILGKYPINIGPVKVSPLLGYSQSQALQAIRLGLVMTGGSLLSPQFKIVDIGFEDNQFTTGGRVDIGLSKSAYMSTEYLYSIGAGSNAQSFKLSSGFDLGIGKRKRWYWRPELMYQYTRTAYNDKATMSGTIPEISMDGTKYERSTHFVGLYVGLGYKW